MSQAAVERTILGVSGSATAIKPSRLLLVDDDRVTLTMLTSMLEKHGHRVVTARSGKEALAILEKEHRLVDSVILDREMPEMGGLEVMRHMQAIPHFATIPVIMHTGSGDPSQIQQGIEAGVFYYLVKPAHEALLRSVVDAALREQQQKRVLLSEINRHSTVLHAMQSCQIGIQTLTEAEDAACFLATCFPQPDRVVEGLLELLINAIEHGNLGITYEEKAQLLATDSWAAEVKRRAALPGNFGKMVNVIYQRKAESLVVQITDAGAGFDWRRYWQIDPARATAANGRGIARARLLAFDRLAYNEAGNQVTVMVSRAAAGSLQW